MAEERTMAVKCDREIKHNKKMPMDERPKGHWISRTHL
jgi:hypothetical protein